MHLCIQTARWGTSCAGQGFPQVDSRSCCLQDLGADFWRHPPGCCVCPYPTPHTSHQHLGPCWHNLHSLVGSSSALLPDIGPDCIIVGPPISRPPETWCIIVRTVDIAAAPVLLKGGDLQAGCLGKVSTLWFFWRQPACYSVALVDTASALGELQRPSSLRCAATEVGRLTLCSC